MSELLKKPVFTRYRSIKKKSASSGQRTKVSAGQGGMPTHHELRSLDTESDEKMSGEPVEVTRVMMRLPVTMRPRLATLTSDTDTEVSSCEVTSEVGSWEVRPEATLTPGDRVDSGDKSDDVTAGPVINKTNTTNTTSDKSSVSTNTVSLMPAMIDLSLFINHAVICHVNTISIKLSTEQYIFSTIVHGSRDTK